ncbi:MAG: portal protein [Pseudobdellovibrionaceae bacterium]
MAENILPLQKTPDTALAARLAFQTRKEAAVQRRNNWAGYWDECYRYALPQRGMSSTQSQSARSGAHLYDGTALDAVDQLAASLLGHLTPPWTQWFGLKPGPDVPDADREALSIILEKAAKIMSAHFDRSNFAVELHQCFLDLVVGGTASLLFEEAGIGELSAFRFASVPLTTLALEENGEGVLDGVFRTLELTLAQLRDRYPFAELPVKLVKTAEKNPDQRFRIDEAVMPLGEAYLYEARLTDEEAGEALVSVKLADNPFIAFRWMKSPGDIYGRSPVMKILPDIKTANKVVELILKNASIAISGIWQADDDGVLNPANIELVPGAIIPKAVGSKGLTPLQMPGNFDVSQLVLEDLRTRIRHALLIDRLPQISARAMTATEVLERASEMALLLGATYGRLQGELLTPLIRRAYTILKRRGEVPDLRIDGRMVEIDYRSPLARVQGQKHVQNTLSWISSVMAMGPEAQAAINLEQAALFLGEAMGVPSDLMRRTDA